VCTQQHNYNDTPVPLAPLGEHVVIAGYHYWRGTTSDGTLQVTVLQSKVWLACERAIETLIGGRGSNLTAHPAWTSICAAARDAEVWRHHHDGASVIVVPAKDAHAGGRGREE
jgi:hypothetical protein